MNAFLDSKAEGGEKNHFRGRREMDLDHQGSNRDFNFSF